MSIEDYKNIAETVQYIVTAGAIIVAGLWTYYLFIENRSNYPIADIELSYVKFNVLEDKILIHASVKITNKGSVLLKAEEAELRLRQVTPLPEETVKIINSGGDLVAEGETEVMWPLIAGRLWKYEDEPIEIEPGESDVLHADFAIKNDIEIVEFYFYLKNKAKENKQLGWSITKMLNISKEEMKNE